MIDSLPDRRYQFNETDLSQFIYGNGGIAMIGQGPYYLEDLYVGFKFATASHRVDTHQIKTFAGQFDPQPFHLDEEAAEDTLFAGLAASGWHTAAMTMNLLVTSGAPLAGGIIGAGAEVSWPRPTRPGDELRVLGEIVEILPSRSKPTRGMVTLRSETFNQREELLQIMTAKVVVPRRMVPIQ